MSAASKFRYFVLAYFSKPASDRNLYRLVRQHRWANILQIGLGDGQRASRLLEVALRYRSADEIRYTGIDMFEAAGTGSTHLSLKAAHQLFRPHGIRVQLIPGDPASALARIANSLQGIDLVLISGDQDPESLARTWFYLPRVLGDRCEILCEQTVDGQKSWKLMPRTELQALATKRRMKQAA